MQFEQPEVAEGYFTSSQQGNNHRKVCKQTLLTHLHVNTYYPSCLIVLRTLECTSYVACSLPISCLYIFCLPLMQLVLHFTASGKQFVNCVSSKYQLIYLTVGRKKNEDNRFSGSITHKTHIFLLLCLTEMQEVIINYLNAT